MQLHIVSDEQAGSPKSVTSLAELATMLGAISDQLSGACEELQRAASMPAPFPDVPQFSDTSSSSIQIDVRRARSLRALRRQLLGDEYFSGPGWDILLHLFESHLEQVRDTVGSACDGSAAAATTALRWISRLEDDQLIAMRDDPLDARRRFVELTPAAIDVMTKYFFGATTHPIAA